MAINDPEGLRAALTATDGIRAVVAKERRLLLWEGSVRIHLDAVADLGTFVELEAVAGPGSDLAREHDQVARLRDALGIRDAALVRGLLRRRGPGGRPGPRARGDGTRRRPARLRALLELPRRRGDPHHRRPPRRGRQRRERRLPAGAVRREASAIGALVAGGGGQIAEVVVASPSAELCTPCGGCRQRLREFAPLDAPIHLVGNHADRVRRTTSLAELLPLSFGPEHLAG